MAPTGNQITGQLADGTGLVINFEIKILPELAIMKMDSKKYTRKLYNSERRIYGENIILEEKSGAIVQKWPGKTVKEITKDILTKLQRSQVNITKNEKIN